MTNEQKNALGLTIMNLTFIVGIIVFGIFIFGTASLFWLYKILIMFIFCFVMLYIKARLDGTEVINAEGAK